MATCQKCKKEISVWKSYPQKGGFCLCKDCKIEIKDNPKILDRLRDEFLKQKSRELKNIAKIANNPVKIKKGNLVVKVKREKRSISATIFLLLFGFCLIIIGAVVFIFSIPLMLMIIGFFSGAGAVIILCLGAYLMAISVYKNNNARCPNCGEINKMPIIYFPSTKNAPIRTLTEHSGKAFTCIRCQKRVLVEYS